MTEAERFTRRLKALGLSDPAIEAAWPDWWSDVADPSPSAKLDLRFSVARNLGLDPRSLVDEEGLPRFVWKGEARFKHLSGETEVELAAISSFGRALASLLISASNQGQYAVSGATASELRDAILKSQNYVRLVDLLSLSWAAGIPVIHLRVYPASHKRMAAMSVGFEDRSSILLARDSMYPPHIAFYMAHELGHIALGHVRHHTSIVDMDSAQLATATDDPEEAAADQFALELLTGRIDPLVMPASGNYNAPGLADAVLRAAENLRIEPGTLALCFGYSTRNWAVVNSAMKFIYADAKPVWSEVNRLAVSELDLNQVPTDSRSYLSAVMGSPKQS